MDYRDEVLYQRLMPRHHRLGRSADTVWGCQCCRETVATAPGVDPSSATEELYKRIKPRGTWLPGYATEYRCEEVPFHWSENGSGNPSLPA